MKKLCFSAWLIIALLSTQSCTGEQVQENNEPTALPIEHESETPPKPEAVPEEPKKTETKMEALTRVLSGSNGGQDALDLCLKDENEYACNYFFEWCGKKDSSACYVTASILTAQAKNDPVLLQKARFQLIRACTYGSKRACEENELMVADDLALRVKQTVKCAMSEQKVVDELGEVDGSFSCTDNNYTAFRYGRWWVFFKGHSAFMLMDHADYKGPCYDNQSMYTYGNHRGVFICQ